jgi:hypothetical protein
VLVHSKGLTTMARLVIRPLGGGMGCLIMIAVSVGLSVLLTILLNLGR